MAAAAAAAAWLSLLPRGDFDGDDTAVIIEAFAFRTEWEKLLVRTRPHDPIKNMEMGTRSNGSKFGQILHCS